MKTQNLSIASVQKHKHLAYNLKDYEYAHFNPTNFSSNAECVTFEYQTPSFPIRFLKNPIGVDYFIDYKNTDFNEREAESNTNMKRHYFTPASGVYLPPYVAYPFFQRCEIFVDGQLLYDCDQTSGIYQSCNRSVSTSYDRRTAFGSDLEVSKRFRLEGTNRTLATFKPTPHYTEVMSMATCKTDKDKEIKKTMVSFDGAPFLSPAKNFAASKSRGFDVHDNANIPIPPKTRMLIRLWRTDPSERFLVYDDEGDGKYLNATENGVQMTKTDVKVNVTDVKLYYESLNVEGPNMFNEKGLKYYFDTPDIRMAAIESGHKTTLHAFDIPKNALGAYVFYIPDYAQWWFKTKKKFNSFRFTLPLLLQDVKFFTEDKPIIWKNGLVNIGRNKLGYISEGAELFYKYMTEHGFIDRPFSDVFGATYFTYQQLPYLDFGLVNKTKSPSKLSVESTWTGANSPGNYYVVCVFVTESSITRDARGVWSRDRHA